MNGNVDLTTDEKKLEVVYGSENPSGSRKSEEADARHSLRYILSDLSDLKRSFIRLGFHLYEFRMYAFYYVFGYLSMEDFCEANLGLSKSAVSRLINVYLEFSKVQDYTRTMFLDEKYQDYSYSQLCEMLNMTDEQRRQVRPDMTVKEIRDLKKNVSRNVLQVATSQLADKFGCTIRIFDKSGSLFLESDGCSMVASGDNSYSIYLSADPEP